MILDQYGRQLPELLPNRPQPRSGRWLLDDPNDRNYTDVSRDLSPERVDSIMSRANQGDAADQAELANLLLEKNHEIKHAFSVRVNSILGLKYTVEPGDDDSPEARSAAEAFHRALKNCGDRDDCDGFRDLLRDMMRAILVGYSVNEIIWGPGGSLLGFASVPSRDVNYINSFSPTIRLSGGAVEMPLEPDKFVYLATRENGSDPARGGLVRPLAWLHCFLNVNIKDLLSFIESYAMPVIIAKVSDSAFESELTHLMNLIRSFGPNGGGIVSQGTELSTIQAPNVTGEVYFRVIEYIKDAITRLILGQTASSGDGGGLSKDNAQDKVRQDILEADATMLADCINRKIAAPWSRFNFGFGVARPSLVFITDPPEDSERNANTLKTLFEAGFEADGQEISERFGWKMKRRAAEAGLPDPNASVQGETDAESARTLNLKQKYDAMGVAIRGGFLTATPEIEEHTRSELGLPPMTEDVRKAWAATGGIRQPITLKTTEEAAVAEALDVDDKAAAANPAAMGKGNLQLAESWEKKKETPESILSWLGPTAEAIEKILDGSEEEADKALKNGTLNFGDSGKYEDQFVKTGIAAAARGIVEQYEKVNQNGRIRGGKRVDQKTPESSDGEKLT